MPRNDDDYNDDYEDRDPRRRAKSKSNLPLILGIIGGLLLVCFVGCGVSAIGLILPGVAKVREAAAKAQNANNMKMISLAFLNQESVVGGYAAPFAVNQRDFTVYPGHSWRTGLLPYLEYQSIYQGIDLTKPWDSPENSLYTNSVVKVYQDVLDPNQSTTDTHIKVFVGGGAMFSADGKPTPITSVTDGLSNTLLAIQAYDPVTWAKPADIAYTANGPLPKFGSPWSNNRTFMIVMADGAVRVTQSTIAPATLHLLIQKADGTVVPDF